MKSSAHLIPFLSFQDLVYDGEQIGLARPEAVYRTNHGYDAYTIAHYMWNGTNAYKNSIARYEVFPEQFDSYQSANTKITYKEAVSITALVGEKVQLRDSAIFM